MEVCSGRAGRVPIATGIQIGVASSRATVDFGCQSSSRVRRDKVDKAGRVTLRYRGRMYHLGVGNAHAGWRVLLLVAGLDVQIVAIDDSSPLRHLILDPRVDTGACRHPEAKCMIELWDLPPGPRKPVLSANLSRPFVAGTHLMGRVLCPDVLTQPSPMSRDITESGRRESNPRPQLGKPIRGTFSELVNCGKQLVSREIG